MTPPPIEVIHFADPWCWWSWGFAPVLRRLQEVYGENLMVTTRMGGIFFDLGVWMRDYELDAEATKEWIRQSLALIRNPLHPDYFWRCGVKSTVPACLAVKAAQLQGDVLAGRYLRRLMEAYMIESRPASQGELIRLATEVGLDGNRVRRDVEAPPVKEAFDEDRRQMEDLEANFLSLVIRAEDGRSLMHGEAFTSRPYEEAIDELAPGLRKHRPENIEEYMGRDKGMVTAHEIAEVFRIEDRLAAAKLDGLARNGVLTAHTFDGIECWWWTGTRYATDP